MLRKWISQLINKMYARIKTLLKKIGLIQYTKLREKGILVEFKGSCAI